MYKSFSPKILEEMKERGDILVTIKRGWEDTGGWDAKPSFISYTIGHDREHIFRCYFMRENDVVQISDVEPTELISGKKALVDAYMYITLNGLIEFANSLGAKRLIFDSFVPAAADHMLDLGFNVTSKGISGGSRGCKSLKD